MRNQLYVALAVGYIIKEEFEKVNEDLENLANQTGGFIQYLEKKRKSKQFKIR